MTVLNIPPVRVVFDPPLREKILAGIDDCLSRGSVAAGKKVQEFESFWASYCGCAQGVATSSGGSALEVLMRALGVSGKDVLVPTNTFIATASAVIFAGGNSVFMDTDPKTFGVSLEEIKKRQTPNTAGVIVVHIGGIVTPEIEAIADWCREQGLWLVEDAAHAHGSEMSGRRPGSFGIAAAYSFFATKVITSGEGGMVVTSDVGLSEACRRFRDYGKKSQWESLHSVVSANFRMGDLTAVVGLEHARRLDGFISERDLVAKQYTQALKGVVDLVLPSARSSWYKYIAMLPKGIPRDAFKTAMKEKGVSMAGGVYDLPLHRQPVFLNTLGAAVFPNADDVCARHICLPIFSGMTDSEIEHVINAFKEVLFVFQGGTKGGIGR